MLAPERQCSHSRNINALMLSMEAVKRASGQICRHILSLKPCGDHSATTLMAGYMAFRAERCDMQAFTLPACLSIVHTFAYANTTHSHTPQGLPLITADLCTFGLWNESRGDQRTARHTSLHVSSFHLSLSLTHPSIIYLSSHRPFPVGCLLFLPHCQWVVQCGHREARF